MYEDFSSRTQRVLMLARLKAGQRGAGAIDVEDLLVALLVEDLGGFREAMSGVLGFTGSLPQEDPWAPQPFFTSELTKRLLARVEAFCTRSQPIANASDMPLSEEAKRVLAASAALKDELKQRAVEPLHLLAAVAEDEASRCGQLLTEAAVTRVKVVKALVEGAIHGPSSTTQRERRQ